MIYIITKGSYSCYHVIAATTDRKIAEKIKKKFSNDWEDCRIEKFPDAEVMLRNVWNVYFKRNGDVRKCELSNSEYDHQWCGRIVPVLRDDYNLIVTVEAENEVSAIKIAAEKRAQYLSEKNGL